MQNAAGVDSAVSPCQLRFSQCNPRIRNHSFAGRFVVKKIYQISTELYFANLLSCASFVDSPAFSVFFFAGQCRA